MHDGEWLAGSFERHRPHLLAVAYRMLGSLAEADDAVQDAWLRLSRSGTEDVENLGGWLTTIVARVNLNMLRSRNHRREEPLGVHLPDPVIGLEGELQPEEAALLTDSVGLALLRCRQVGHDSYGPRSRRAHERRCPGQRQALRRASGANGIGRCAPGGQGYAHRPLGP
jgi:DNA-directed RNA polymerase specialized sigma24 family protein